MGRIRDVVGATCIRWRYLNGYQIGDQILLPFGRSRLIYTVVERDRPHGSLYINFKVINNETQEEEIETFRINERIDRLVDDESGNPV